MQLLGLTINQITEETRYNYFITQGRACASQYFKNKILSFACSYPNPAHNILHSRVIAEISSLYPKLKSVHYKTPNHLGRINYFGTCLDFLHHTFSKSVEEVCLLYMKGNESAEITQAIYLSYKVSLLQKISNLEFQSYFAKRYRLSLEIVYRADFPNDESLPSIFEDKVHRLKPGRYLVTLSEQISLVFIKEPNTTGYIFDPNLATIRSLNPPKDLWNIARQYGFGYNSFVFTEVTKY